MTDLLNCPFCGGEAVASNMTLEGAVCCSMCHASLVRKHQYVHDTGYAEAIAAWNTRTDTIPDDPRVKALVEAVKEVNSYYWASSDVVIPSMGDLDNALRAIEEGGE